MLYYYCVCVCTCRSSLHSLATREKRQSSNQAAPNRRSNYRYLSSPEKIQRLHQLRKNELAMKKKIDRLKAKLSKILEDESVVLDDDTSLDLRQIMEEEEPAVLDGSPKNSFQVMFWSQQKEALRKQKRNMRWHPMIIKWCIYLRHLSGKAYESLRESGCISLPSQHTLRDYTHCVKAEAGFSSQVSYS